MFLTVEFRKVDGTSLGVLVLNRKTFRSGKEGWFGQAKMAIDGKRHQCQVQAVEIGSKPKSDAGDVQAEE